MKKFEDVMLVVCDTGMCSLDVFKVVSVSSVNIGQCDLLNWLRTS